ncbi:hypothetical protein H6P81_002919 [Aristolochia fimbriata]|uniref:Retrovirus-related Pol polyprotein from transposon TNT 1-94-like beta-barrel domain-containing protein n=1 Tax=Aristolochia fimbriata TaxID=158543 RepID=A0AAV7FEA6_ARIFI|nr:hypothetical protein H6P81_002919 [Aristolochia fimbriata]
MDWDTVVLVHLCNMLTLRLALNGLESLFLHVITVRLMDISDLTATSCKDIGEGMEEKEIGLFAAHTARKSNTDGVWYFERGCSRHMAGSTKFLTNLHKESGGQVTFVDGAKGFVIGKGDLNVKGLPKLKNVLLVDGMKANLISISQLCD